LTTPKAKPATFGALHRGTYTVWTSRPRRLFVVHGDNTFARYFSVSTSPSSSRALVVVPDGVLQAESPIVAIVSPPTPLPLSPVGLRGAGAITTAAWVGVVCADRTAMVASWGASLSVQRTMGIRARDVAWGSTGECVCVRHERSTPLVCRPHCGSGMVAHGCALYTHTGLCVCVCVFDQVLLGVTQEHSCMLHALDLTQFCGGAVPIQRRHVRTALQFFSKIPFDALRSCPEVTTACVAAQFSFPSPNHAVDFVSVLTHVSTLCHGHGKRSLWRWDGTVEGGCMV